MTVKLLRELIKESLHSQGFIQHVKNGLGYARGNGSAMAVQIVDDWLEEVELSMGNMLSPGHVSQMERFVVREWPVVLERYRGNETLALIAMTNLMDAKYVELDKGGSR